MEERKIRVIRHAQAKYPEDELTLKGKHDAKKLALRIGSFRNTVCSPRTRAIETARAFNEDPVIDGRLSEYEDPDINEPTAEEYVRALHLHRLDRLITLAKDMRTAIEEQEDEALMVSHNAIMSGLVRLLTGSNEIMTFDNLEGFTVNRNRDDYSLEIHRLR